MLKKPAMLSAQIHFILLGQDAADHSLFCTGSSVFVQPLNELIIVQPLNHNLIYLNLTLNDVQTHNFTAIFS